MVVAATESKVTEVVKTTGDSVSDLTHEDEN